VRARLAALLVLLGALAGPARASDWGLIVPGESTLESVRARYGSPTRAENQKVENYDAVEWVYQGAQAPPGVVRLTVSFGLLTPGGYKKDVVRTFRLEPKPGSFNKKLVVDGWGRPTRTGFEGRYEIFLYEQGLLVYFDKDDGEAATMVFTPPQPLPAAPPQR
jgi:hypothetical protein